MEMPREAGVPSLREALRRARTASAERTGVLVELRTAEMARLDLLKEKLEPVFAQVPQDVELFDSAIMPGDPARLFIDVLGFVELDRDKRTYRFFQDTRHGRRLLAETESLDGITQAITDYVAHRIVEREKALASDVPGSFVPRAMETAAPAVPTGPAAPATPAEARRERSSSLPLIVLVGILIAIGAFWASGFVWDAGR
jgi:hypothetical protein